MTLKVSFLSKNQLRTAKHEMRCCRVRCTVINLPGSAGSGPCSNHFYGAVLAVSRFPIGESRSGPKNRSAPNCSRPQGFAYGSLGMEQSRLGSTNGNANFSSRLSHRAVLRQLKLHNLPD